MIDQIGSTLLTDVLREFTNQRTFAERAMSQLSDDEFFRTLGGEENSVAILVKHVGGNLRSRWTDFLESDGEKPDRDRDSEFEPGPESRSDLMGIWDRGFGALARTLGELKPADLLRTVRIRNEELSVIKALNRSLAHASQHVGQIILLSRHFRGSEWQTISIPKKPRG